MSGLIPGVPADRDSPVLAGVAGLAEEARERARCGGRRSPSLFSPQLRRTTIITTLMFTCSFAAAFGAIQQMPQIVPGLPEVQARVAAARAEKGFDKREPRTALRRKLASEGKSETGDQRRRGRQAAADRRADRAGGGRQGHQDPGDRRPGRPRSRWRS